MPAFANYRNLAYPYRFSATLRVKMLCGGIPSDKDVATAWLKARMGLDNDKALMQAVATTMAEREVTLDEATKIVNDLKHLNGFKRVRCANCPPEALCNGEHQLMIEGRQVKAALKEAVSVAVAAGNIEQKGWGNTRKWLSTYFPEHVFVNEDDLPLFVRDANGVLVPAMQPTGVNQRFVHTHRGTGIQYEEFVRDAVVSFTVISDHDFTEKDWAMLWMTGEKQGLGATRSQGYGVYEVEEWEVLQRPAKKARKAASTDEDTDEDTGGDDEELSNAAPAVPAKKVPAKKAAPRKAVPDVEILTV